MLGQASRAVERFGSLLNGIRFDDFRVFSKSDRLSLFFSFLNCEVLLGDWLIFFFYLS